MKITQEVRDFAAKQEAGVLNAPPPSLREEQAGAASQGEGAAADAEQGMAQMSARYREGGDLYLPAGD